MHRSTYRFVRRLILTMVLCFLAVVIPAADAGAEELASLKGDAVEVFHAPALADAARQTAALFPDVKAELEAILGLPADFRPAVVLLADRAAFEQVTGSRLIVAYALPSRMLMVIDHPRASRDPFGTRPILKHELCHLVLHHHIPTIPRWLDEGICQWASDGLAELLSSKGGASLPWRSLSGSLPPLASLDHHFPRDERGLVLAYEQSRSVVDFIVSRHGTDSIRNILTALKHGMSVDDTMKSALGTTMPALEEDWRRSLGGWPAVLVFVMANIYTILFFFAALFTVAGYVRYRIRKGRLRDEGDTEPFPEDP